MGSARAAIKAGWVSTPAWLEIIVTFLKPPLVGGLTPYSWAKRASTQIAGSVRKASSVPGLPQTASSTKALIEPVHDARSASFHSG